MTSSNIHNKFIAYILPLTAALIICRAFPVLSFFYYAVPFILLFTFIFLFRRSSIYSAKTDYLFPAPYPNLHPDSSKIPAGKLNLPTDTRLKTLLLLIAAFGIWAAITFAWSPFPLVTLSRAAYFFLISVSPLLLGYFWSKNEQSEPFAFLLPANIIVVMVSLYSLISSSPANAWTGGHGLGFMGYAGHQNTLAAAIVFTVPSVLFPLFKEISRRVVHKSKSDADNFQMPLILSLILPSLWLRRVKLIPGTRTIWWAGFISIFIFILIFILNLYLLILSVSRAGVLTLIIMVAIFIFLSFNKKTALVLMFMSITLSAVFFFSSKSVREFVFKTEGTIGDRRIVNIHETIEAAKNGGLFGLGYGISKKPGNDLVIGHYEYEGKVYVREKMIGSLALIEETGVVGLILFLAPLGYVLWELIKNIKYLSAFFIHPSHRHTGLEDWRNKLKIINIKLEAAFLIGVLVAFCFHAQVEAWWVGVGSIELPIFYTIMGNAVGSSKFAVSSPQSNPTLNESSTLNSIC
jgi:hypothetical protein